LKCLPVAARDVAIQKVRAASLRGSFKVNPFRVLRFTAVLAGCFFVSTIGFAQTQTEEIEPNDLCPNAQPIELPGLPLYINGELVSAVSQEMPGDIDFLRFEAAEGTWLRARLLATASDSIPEWDPFLGLFDADCNLVTANDDYLNLNSRIDFAVPPGGVFILAVTGCCDWPFEGYHVQEGTYQLRLLEPPVPVAAVTGRVVDAVTGDPIPWSWVELIRCIREECYYSVNGQSTDENGVFRFESDSQGIPLDPANYLVHAMAPEYQPAETGPYMAYSSETLDFGDIALDPPPFIIENIKPCADIPAAGGSCKYSVAIRNNTNNAVKGLGWSLVSTWGVTSPMGFSTFPAEKSRQIKVPARSFNTLAFSFDIPAGVAEGTVMCPQVWFSDRATEYFGTLRSQDLFCVMKQAGVLEFVDPKKAAAGRGIIRTGH
jgi:hypothetical protein